MSPTEIILALTMESRFAAVKHLAEQAPMKQLVKGLVHQHLQRFFLYIIIINT
jgi:hypothetical protein